MTGLLDAPGDSSATFESLADASAAGSLLAPPLPPLESFGEYQDLRPLARGGMGIVYQARQARLNRLVALKLIPGGKFAKEADLRRFRSEAEAAARLDHPNIVPIYEVGEHQGQPYFAMKLIQGSSLAAHLAARHPQTTDARRVSWISKAARAVHFAHEHGILHRDIKPANILIDANDEPQVTDFGLAKVAGRDTNLTLSDAILGTPAYMPPEQAMGNSHQTTTSSDVYGLGAVLYELLAGRPPFQGHTVLEILHKVLHTDPIPPRNVVPSADPDLETICLKCLEKEPGRRYASASQLADDLDRWQRHEPILAKTPTVIGIFSKWTRRHPWIAAFGFLLALSAVTIFVLSAQFTLRITAESERNRRQIVQLHVSEGNRLLADGDPSLALVRLTSALRLDETGSNTNLIHRQRLAHALRRAAAIVQLQSHDGPAYMASFSPDGQWIASASEDGTARIWSATSGQDRFPPLRHPAAVSCALFSPDGSRLATTCSDGKARLWNATTGEAVGEPFDENEAQFKRSTTLRVAFSPDSRKVLSAHGTNAILRDAASGAVVQSGLTLPTRILHASFSPSGRLIVLVGVNGHARLYATNTGAPVHPLWRLPNGSDDDWACGLFSADETKVLVACQAGDVRLWSVSTGQPISPVLRHAGPPRIYHAGFCRQDTLFFTVGSDGRIQFWDAANGVPVGDPPSIPDSENPPSSPALATERPEIHLPFLDGAVRVRDIVSSNSWPVLRHGSFVFSASLSPDRQRMVTADKLGLVRIWSLPRAPSTASLEAGDRLVQLGWLPTGRSFVSVTATGSLRVWEVDGDRVSTHDELNLNLPSPLLHASLDPMGERVALAGSDETLRLVNLKTHRDLCPPMLHEAPVRHIAFSHDGRKMVSITKSPLSTESVARVWDAASGTAIGGPIQHPTWLDAAEFSPDDTLFLTACADGHVRIFDSRSLQPVQEPLHAGGYIWEAHFSPDGRRILAASTDYSYDARSAFVFAPGNAKQTVELRGHRDGVTQAVFSPDGTRAATGSEDSTARIWDPRSGYPITDSLRHQGKTTKVTFNADSTLLATASQDTTARVWDAATGEPVTPPLRHRRAVQWIQFSPDTRWLLTGSEDGEIHLWDLRPERQSQAGVTAATQLLTAHQAGSGESLAPLSRDAVLELWRNAVR